MQLEKNSFRNSEVRWLQAGPSDASRIFLMLHGFPDDPGTYRHQIHGFSRDSLCVAPFLRDSGPSSRFDLDAVALDHLSVLRELDPQGEKSLVIVGHDIGAIHAWHLARLLDPGRRLDGLVILNGLSVDQMARRFGLNRQLLMSWYILLFQVPGVSESLVRHFGEKLFYGPLEKGARLRKSVGLIPHYRAALRELPKILLRPPARLQAPVLALWGKEDPYVMIPSETEFSPVAEESTLRVLEGGHWIHEGSPQRINTLIESFLKRIERDSFARSA